MKMLLWVLLAVAIFWWLTRSKKTPEQPRRDAKDDAGKPAAESLTESEAMVCCAYCGTYVPRSESVTAPAGESYCSKEHLALHSSSQTRA